ncbi:MAG: metallophosphoesterase [Bacilli bacterium]|nr:metallophosphoesterase [Bacilli bacterium]
MKKGLILSIIGLTIFGMVLTSCSPSNTEQKETEKVSITVINGSGTGIYEKGKSITISTLPQQGKIFIGWMKDNQLVSTLMTYTFTANDDGVYIAHFEDEEKPVKVNIIVEGGTGSGTYDVGDSVTIIATPQQGKTFVRWMYKGDIVSTDTTYTFIASESGTYTAIFVDSGLRVYEKTIIKKSNQDFKILNFTDIQLHDGEDYSVAEHVIETLVEREKPDMITFLGDLLNDDKTYNSVVNAKKFISQVDSYDIPWAPIFGNHDYEDYQTGYQSAKTTTSSELASWYSEAENCLFTYGPSEVPGKGNYFVTVEDETTGKPVQTLIFFDSRLSGLSDAHDTFYRQIIDYSKGKNDGKLVPSTFFSHIALSQYGDEYEKSRQCEYSNIVGSISRNPCDLASGTRLLFESMKELGSTDMVVCGHDHENAYYTVKDGITLGYSMKSSQGDNFTNFAEIGGSVVTFSDETKSLKYSKVLDLEMKLTGTSSKMGDYVIHPDTLPNWRFSGGKLCFDIEIPKSGSLKFNIEGTNKYRPNQDEKTRLGEWNRLTTNVDIVGGSNPTVDFGRLTKISGSKYSYELDLTKIDLNLAGGEEAYGSETARLVYFNSIIGDFKITNFRYEMEKITETNQADLANAVVGKVDDKFVDRGLPIRPTPTVSLNETNLVFADDFYIVFENNFNAGIAKGTILPSGKGAHKYKGSKEFTFNIVENPDDDKKPGHENAIQIDENIALEKNNFIGEAGLKDWHAEGNVLQFDIKPLVYGKKKGEEGETTRFALFGTNLNLPESQRQGSWDRLTDYYHIDFGTKSIHLTGKTSEDNTICHFVDITDGWYRVSIPLNKFVLNDGAQGNDNETLKLIYFEYVKRSFKIANFKVNGGDEPFVKTTEFKMNDDDFVVANFTDVHVTDQSMISETGTTGKTIKYGVEHSNPDIMLFSGDVAGNLTQLGYLLDYLDQFEIPYFFVQGNHDHQFLNYNSMETRIAQSKYGYIEKGPDSLASQGNYTIKIKNSSDELVHGFIMMDTGNKHSTIDDSLVEYVKNPISGVKYGSYKGQTTYCDSQGWDGLHGNQIDWYESTVNELGCDTSLICHIPPLEFVKAYEQYQDAKNKSDTAAIAACAPIGQCNMGEQCCGSIEQYGLFESVLSLGSTKNIICGHDHLNDFSLLYKGVRLTYSLKTGEGSYWKDDGTRCGYTELTIDKSGKTSLDQIYFNPLI